jgi:hypothetical protein
MQRLIQVTPTARVSVATPIFVSPEHRDKFANALQQAGPAPAAVWVQKMGSEIRVPA